MVDELPDPVNVDYNFGSYHSKTEVSRAVIRYTRTYEINELSVAPANAEEVKKFNRIIASGGRSVVMLKPDAK